MSSTLSNNWSFVIAGYSITAVVFTSYIVWIRQKSKHLRRTLREENRD